MLQDCCFSITVICPLVCCCILEFAPKDGDCIKMLPNAFASLFPFFGLRGIGFPLYSEIFYSITQ